ncbi:MAG: hypothetical protein U9R21_09660 [Candidatus Thermoplasmatota archaeon]|nr:hypothetical protein [Candidatus Thermoplasmatota archaeon]
MTKENKSAMSMIKPSAFVHQESEKTKLNWFCYEMSMTFYEELNENLGKLLKKYRIHDRDIARFSIYLSKRMKDIILEKLSGRIDKVYFSYEMVESYFPKINDRLVNKVLNVLSKAWYKQLDFCVVCPTRCVSEKDVYCTMFDEEDF